MAEEFLKFMTGIAGGEPKKTQYSIAPGVVTNILDVLGEARVEVHIPSHPGLSPQARLISTGGSGGTGFFWLPQFNDEVLVAFNQDDLRDAYILGGLWSTIKRPPVMAPWYQLMKRVIKTGMVMGFGHEIEFDDALQSITIKSSTQDKIVIGPGKIEISPLLGLKITLSLLETPPSISLEAQVGNIELKAPFGKISLDAGLGVEIKTNAICSIEGTLVKIN